MEGAGKNFNLQQGGAGFLASGTSRGRGIFDAEKCKPPASQAVNSEPSLTSSAAKMIWKMDGMMSQNVTVFAWHVSDFSWLRHQEYKFRDIFFRTYYLEASLFMGVYGLGGAANNENHHNSRESPYFRIILHNILFDP